MPLAARPLLPTPERPGRVQPVRSSLQRLLALLASALLAGGCGKAVPSQSPFGAAGGASAGSGQAPVRKEYVRRRWTRINAELNNGRCNKTVLFGH